MPTLRRAAALQAGRAPAGRSRAGRTRSSSTAIACSCASRTARRRCAPARASTGRRSSRRSPSRRETLPDCMIDGEAVALDAHGAPDFAALQAALSEGKTGRPDLLRLRPAVRRGEDLRALPLRERKARLKALLDGLKGKHARCATSIISRRPATRCWNRPAACTSKASSPSSSTRPIARAAAASWIKAKCRAGQEVVIGGWTSEGKRLRSLLVGVHRDGAARSWSMSAASARASARP